MQDMLINALNVQVPFVVTLGPNGTCHERAVRAYMASRRVHHYRLELTESFFEGLDLIRGAPEGFLVQCSAHPLVHEVTERDHRHIFVVDTFLYPTRNLALLARREVRAPRSLGLVPATAGYIDRGEWNEIIDVVSKPIVGKELLEGRYDAGLTHLDFASKNPEDLRVMEEFGEVDTTWVVYGTRRRFQGALMSTDPGKGSEALPGGRA